MKQSFCMIRFEAVPQVPTVFVQTDSDGKESCLQCGKPRFDPWVGKSPWRRKWQPTPVFLPGESQGWRSLVEPGRLPSMGSPRVEHNWATSLSFSVYWMFSFWLCWVFTAVRMPAFSSCGMWAWLPLGKWDLSSLPKDWTYVSCIGRQILNHWTTREVLVFTEFIDIPLSAFA